MDRQEKRMAKWKKIKSRGIIAYTIKMGIIFYGLSFFLTWVFLVPFVDSNFTFNFVYGETFITRLIVFGIVSPLLGILMGYVSWRGLEKKYSRDVIK